MIESSGIVGLESIIIIISRQVQHKHIFII